MSKKKPKADASKLIAQGGVIFSDEIIEIPVKVGENKYVLKEATGYAVNQLTDFLVSRTKLIDGRVSGARDIAGSEALLLSHCLFKAEGKKDNVPSSVILSWPNKVVSELFDILKDISGLDDEDEDSDDEEQDTAKNGQSESTDGS